MTFYSLIFIFLYFFLCFFYDFLSINLYINLSILFSVSFYNFLLINLHVSFHVFIYLSIYDFLSMLFHHVFEQTHWENLYHLLCAFSFYFSTNALRKFLSFTMCFLILFLDFLWKHAWAQLSLTEKISIIYYVLSRRTHCHWENLYYLMSAFSLNRVIEKTSIIYYVLSHSISWFSLKTRMSSTRSYWENLYHLLCAFSSNRAFRRAHCHWENLYYLLCAFSSNQVIEEIFIIYYVLLHSILRRARFSLKTWLWTQLALIEKISIIYYVLSHWIELLRKSLLFTMCFLDECIVIEKFSIILYVLSHRVLQRAHCHWENLYYLVSAFSVIDVRDLTSTLIMIDVKSFLETLRKSLLFSRCFFIIFLDEHIEKR